MATPAELASWWLRIASGDLRAARAALDVSSIPPRHAAYWAHQAAEKALKAVLAAKGTDPPWVHDLVGLADITPESVRGALAPGQLARLTRANAEGRYPGDETMLYDGAEASDLVAEASKVLEVVMTYLASAGSDLSTLEPV